MDYDDNDFQSQNLHLAGEGSTKFPPALRSYALPKFDFDESFQANLRFDSLVETEVFLGIESNEDNHWIDAFSRGGSGIEFSSTAAESCAISRHGNVWSEATSLESVEMLLKSVGQEDYIPKQTTIQESDACDELACLAKQMDPNPKPDDKNELKDNVTVHPHGGTHAKFSELKDNAEMEKLQDGMSQSQEEELSIVGSSGNPELSNICRNIDLPVSEGSRTLYTDDKSNNTNQREVESVAHDIHHGLTQDDSSAVQTNIAESSMQNLSDEKQGPLQTQTNNHDMDSSMTNKEAVVDRRTLDQNAVGGNAHYPDKPICPTPAKETLEGGTVDEGLETGLSSLEDSLRMESVAVSDLQKAEKCSEDTSFRDLSLDSARVDVMLLKDVGMDDQSAPNTCELPKISTKDDSFSERQVVEFSNSSCEICPNLEQNMDVAGNKTNGGSSVARENELSNTGDHVDTQILSIKSEFIVEENKVSTVSEGNSDNVVQGFSSFSMVGSSTKSSILGESTQICVSNDPDRQNDSENFDRDVSVNDQESKKIPSDSSQMHCDVDQSHFVVDKGVVSSSLRAGSMETELTTSTASIDVTPVNNSVSQVISGNISLTSHEIIDIPPPSKVVSADEVTGHNDIHGITPVGSSSVDKKEESTIKIAEESGMSTLVGSSEQESAPYPVMGTEKNSSDASGRPVFEVVASDVHNVGTTSDAVRIDEPQGTTNDNVILECAKESGPPYVLCASSEKQSDPVTVSSLKKDKETVQENPDKSSLKKLGDNLLGHQGFISSASLPDSCVELCETVSGSLPTDSTCSLSCTFGSPSQTEKDENQVKASANQDSQASELISGGAKNILSTAQDLKGNIAANDERSSTPEVTSAIDLSKKDAADVNTEDVSKPRSIPVIATIKASTAMEGSPSTSGLGLKIKTVGNSSHGNLQITDGKVVHSASKTTPERKTRRSSNKTAGKESSKRGSRLKDTTPARQSDRGDKSSKVSLSPSPGFQLMKSNEVQQYGPNDSNNTKSFALTSTSSLPDLNTSAAPPVFFHQPFTDLQQLQLRAQIIVYGALIQGTAPDEICMVQAFGGSDGGRSIWENAWRACIGRQHGQKSLPVNPETPVQSRSVARTSDLPLKQSTVQAKGISLPLGRASTKAPPTVASPLMPLSSPLWSLPTISSDSLQSSALARGSVVDYPQAITPLHPYQTPPGRNFLGHNTPWISQTSLRGQWISSSTPSDNSTHLSASPVLDTIKLGSVKGSSLPPSSGIKNVTSRLPTSNAGLQGIFVGTASPLDANNVTVPPVQHSSDPKPKKRKKVVVSEDLVQRPLQSLAPAVGSHMSTSVAVVTPFGNVPITTVEKSVVSVSPLADQSKNDQNVEQRIMSDESLMKVKEARVHAEEASTLSAAAVNHSLELWNQLEKHKDSGLMSDIEAKLASAAVAVAAATAVAKAAAAAANVASNAALQAKLMADEALLSSGYDNSCQSNQISLSEATNNLGKATPASILKGASGTNCPGSIIVAAKEAVKRRVEAASAATKRAENMDAIVKAAELAAEAISQAGRIVTMGDPLSLSDIVEAGPEGCWKATPESSQQVGLLKDITRDMENVDNVRDIPETSHTHNRNISSGDISASIKINEKNSRGPKGRKVSDLVKPVEVVPGSEPELQAPFFTDINGYGNLEENNIKEGSLVEVFKDEEGYKAGWFIANILSLKDDKAYVCYTSLVAVEDAGPLKEWVSLKCEGNKSPRIRIARPLTMQYEGTRKRRRAAMGDYAWSVGDRVDAWIQESWQEGVVTEKNKKDETTLTIHFPASGETSFVRAWHLRPALIWKDGKWIESSKVRANDSSTHEGDTPHEKRPKLGSETVEVKGKDKMSKGIDAVESAKPDEMRLLNLTENEKVFNIGKSSKNQNKQDSHRMVRTGLQKEGSRVIFGVPKPGKKRKFMEVSKHYVAHESSKVSDRNDSVKLANFLIPQGSLSRGWKNSSKNDTTKPKTFKSGKPQSVLGGVIPPKDTSLSSAFSLTNDQTGHAERIKGSSNHSNSATDAATEGPILFSSLATATDTHPTKRASTSRASKGKLAPASDKSGKGEVEKVLNDNPTKSASDVVEPRRSNRRIQPTSRLLEGLQSSLIISKIPSISHNRNTSKG